MTILGGPGLGGNFHDSLDRVQGIGHQRGSWSIKAVLPTVAPDLDYGELGEIRDGQRAQAAYGEILDADMPEALIHALRDYCRLDTLAIVRLAGLFKFRA